MEEMPLISSVDEDEFQKRVIDFSHQTPVLVDFWADWCPPCLALEPHLKRTVIAFSGRVYLAKVEVDEGENMKLAGRYHIRGFPSVLLFVKGLERDRFSGAKTSSWINGWLEELI
jgi:putative thioredoxin